MNRIPSPIVLLAAALVLAACGTSTNDDSQQIEIEEPAGGSGAGADEPGGGSGDGPGMPGGDPDRPVSNQPAGDTGPQPPPVGGGGGDGAGGGGAGEPGGLVVGEDSCETDADCVHAECCHAAACVAKENAPDCSDVMCTEECRYGTLDCGGKCLCHEGKCAARLSEPPEGVQDAVSPQ